MILCIGPSPSIKIDVNCIVELNEHPWLTILIGDILFRIYIHINTHESNERVPRNPHVGRLMYEIYEIYMYTDILIFHFIIHFFYISTHTKMFSFTIPLLPMSTSSHMYTYIRVLITYIAIRYIHELFQSYMCTKSYEAILMLAGLTFLPSSLLLKYFFTGVFKNSKPTCT